ncbi:MAG: ATP-binding protein, partial [Spirochaetota bacterium]|nr:ATP-binding protein [Spirochaetota bacterium]
EMENLLDEIRSGKIKLNSDLVDLLLKSIDIVKTLINASKVDEEPATGYEEEVINALKVASTGKPASTPAQTAQAPAAPSGSTPSAPSSGSRKVELILNEYERYLIKKAPSEGYAVYEVYVKFDEKNPMKTVSGLQIHSQLKEVSDILKSVPDIDDLMGDEFFNEVLYLVQSELTPDKIYQKVFLSDVTEVVEVKEFTEEVEEGKAGESGEKAMALTPEDLAEIQDQLLKGKRVYKIILTFDDENPMRSVSGVLFYTMLRTKGEVLKSSPSYDEFKEDTFYPTGEFILASPHDTQELRNKLYLSDVTKDLKFQEFKKDHDAPEGKLADTPVKQEAPAAQVQTAQPEPVTSQPAAAAQSQPVESKAPVTSKPAPKKDTAEEPEKKHQVSSVLRVESSRIDEMLNLVGELVIIKASFIQLNDNSSQVLDDLTGSLNQYRVLMRQLLNDVESFFEDQNGGNGNGNKLLSGGSSRESSDHKISKDFFKQKLEDLASHFDTVIPESKTIQDKLKNSSQSLGRITDDLQESVMKVRMVPINQIFSRFPRLVRDISRNLHKNINLIMEGEDTELDKSVIEDLVDPLIHIVRNAVDHAIETPADRQKAGKDPAGTILLKAGHEGNTVTITVKDDGQGINLERVRQKALENKLIDPGQDLSEKEIVKLIFEPGFSTAKEVTSLSGRGVGMDVVS